MSLLSNIIDNADTAVVDSNCCYSVVVSSHTVAPPPTHVPALVWRAGGTVVGSGGKGRGDKGTDRGTALVQGCSETEEEAEVEGVPYI